MAGRLRPAEILRRAGLQLSKFDCLLRLLSVPTSLALKCGCSTSPVLRAHRRRACYSVGWADFGKRICETLAVGLGELTSFERICRSARIYSPYPPPPAPVGRSGSGPVRRVFR